MAFCLVKWIEEDRLSVIPSSWVLQPDGISTANLPVDGVCCWRKKSSRHPTRILSLSDTKKELEEQLVKISSEEEAQKQPEAVEQARVTLKRPLSEELDESAKNSKKRKEAQLNAKAKKISSKEEAQKQPEAVEQARVTLKRPLSEELDESAKNSKKRKEAQLNAKAKKSAEIDSINRAAKEIFEKRSTSTPVSSYIQLEQQLTSVKEELRITCLKLAESDSKLEEPREQLSDRKAALEVKRRMVEDLHIRVTELETENESLKAKQTSDTGIAQLSTGLPLASASDILFLQKLVKFYSRDSHPKLTDDIDDFGGTSEEDDELCDLERKRLQNIERNNRVLFELGLKKPSESVCNGAVKKSQPNPAPQPVQDTGKSVGQMPENDTLRTVTCGGYSYLVTASDLQREQDAFQAGEGRKELVKDFGVYIKFIDLEQCEQSSKQSATGLMRSLISVFYSNERLAACSATTGINANIRTAIFKYCEVKFAGAISSDKLKRDLTNKCGEERRKMKKAQQH